jgi:hypothetical protein
MFWHLHSMKHTLISETIKVSYTTTTVGYIDDSILKQETTTITEIQSSEYIHSSKVIFYKIYNDFFHDTLLMFS